MMNIANILSLTFNFVTFIFIGIDEAKAPEMARAASKGLI